MKRKETEREWKHGDRAWTYVINNDRDGLPCPDYTIFPTYVLLSAGSNQNAHMKADRAAEESGLTPDAKFIVPLKDGSPAGNKALCIEGTCFESRLYTSKQAAVTDYDSEINNAICHMKQKLSILENMLRHDRHPDESEERTNT